jgi:hypothetical protein
METSSPPLALKENTNPGAASSNSSSSVSPADEFSFGLLINRTLGGSDKRRPSDKTANEAQIEVILVQAQNLSKLSQQYQETYIVKGTKELYKLLGQIYSYALQIDTSALRDNILQRMRELLDKEHNIKTQANTHWITTVLRYILPVDRQTSYQYARVLQVAFDENLTPAELPAYIKDRGGIGKVTSTREEEDKAAAVKEHKSKKVDMLKKILLANAFASKSVFEVPDAMVLNAVEEDKKEGTFEFAICVNPAGQERRVIRFVKITEAMESQLLQKLAEQIVSDDLTGMQDKLDQWRAQLGMSSGWGMVPGDKGYQPAGLASPSTPDLSSSVEPEATLNAPVSGMHIKPAA